MKRTFLIPVTILLLVLSSCSSGPRIDEPAVTTGELKEEITFLASDSLRGRYPGTPGCRTAALYIRDHFHKAGLTLLGDDGLEPFRVTVSIRPGKDNRLIIGHDTLKAGRDFRPMSFTANASLTAPVVFAGYGFDIGEDSLQWHDYDGVDVKDKWVLVLRGDPEPEKMDSPFARYGRDRDKAMTAEDKGAAGILFVSGKAFSGTDELDKLKKNVRPVTIPALQITRRTADLLLRGSGLDIVTLEQRLNASRRPHSFEVPAEVSARASVEEEKVQTANVVALLEGRDPRLRDEYIVVGAHCDHLGMGGPNTSSRRPDTVAVHYGADDNASGVATVMELAEMMAARRENLKRSIVFVCFSAEEMGLLGSKHFVNDTLIDMKKVVAMINVDMVGRLKADSTLEIGGTGTSDISDSLLHATPGAAGFRLALSPEGYGPSDHASFYGKEIPVFFFSTGAHLDYHTPFDTPDKINYEGLKKVADFVGNLTMELDTMARRPKFRMAGPKEGTAMKRRGFKVTLGIMPDFAGKDTTGLRVDFVIPGRPAARSGMKNGDVIIAINGKPVHNINDYMYRLARLHEGETAVVEVKRKGEKVVLLVQL